VLLFRPTSVLSLSLLSCSSQDSATITLVTGAETDTFTQTPAPTELVVDAVELTGSDGGAQTIVLATSPLPASTVDLGSWNQSTVAVIKVLGLDATKSDTLVYGASLPLTFSNIVGDTIPIFVQRTGEFARVPSPPSDARQNPTLAIMQGEYLVIGAGTESGDASFDAGSTQLYDFSQMATLGSPPSLPAVPQSIAFDGTVSWLIDGDAGTYFDFSDSDYGAISLPSGGYFADVAGGATVTDENGVQYIVGATRRTGAPSATILKIDPSDTSNPNYPYGNPTWLTLINPRLGASAAWVTGEGLVVCGGSASAPGVEFIGSGQTSAVELAYPPDPSTGGGAGMLDSQHVLLAGGLTPTGGDAGVRIINLQCGAVCNPQPWPGLPIPITSAQTFVSLGGTGAVVVGSESVSGATHVFSLSSGGPVAVPTKVPHFNARATISPTGTLVLFGGAPEIESFTP
jgi:hypothetical protein